MPLNGLDWQTVQVPFAAGLDTKAQSQALDPPGLSRALNVEFDEVGGLRLRKPYASIGSNIYGGGTLSNVRKIVTVGDELLCFTSTTLYSWSEALTAWVSKGTHLAVATSETPVFGNTSDQVFSDRAQLSGVVVYVWTEVLSASTTSYISARDATTGAVLMAPTSLGGATSRPRVVAADSCVFVLWVSAGIGLKAAKVDPAAPALSGLTTVDVSEQNYDAVRHPTADQVVVVTRPAGGASYTVSKVTTAGVVTSSTKARTADGIVALACATGVDRVQILRQDTTAHDYIFGDLLVLSTLADVFTGQTIGDTDATVVNQITCAFRSTTDGGYYRCYCFWSGDEADNTNDLGGVFYNYVDTNNYVSTQAALVYRQGLASRAFDYGGHVFAWTVFGAANNAAAAVIGFEVPVQNACYLYRDDADYYAKAAWGRAGGFGYNTGHLAGVALVSGTTGYAFATTERNFTDLGGYFNTAGYGARAPRDVVFTFDSDDARRTVQFGRTMYVSGGVILQYDGEGLAEVGFEQFPWYLLAQDDATAGSLAAGDYSYKNSYRWDNARGETERSTTAIGQRLTVAASKKPLWKASQLRATKKRSTRRNPALEMWRTAVNPTTDAPFYLVTSRDPSATGDNGYVESDAAASAAFTSQRDNFTDAVLTTKEQHPENAGILPCLAPPPATVLLASDTRLFLAGVANEPNRVWYSRLRSDGEIASFNSALSFILPAAAGTITGLALWQESLLVFTSSAIYLVAGDGYDNLGGGTNYGPPRILTTDVGALSHDTIAVTPGGVIFFSRKGWYRLNAGLGLEYIGAKVEDYNTDTWVAAQVVESQHQIRVLSTSRMLMFDYLVGEWSEWSQSGGKALARWRTYPMLLDTAVKKEQSTFSAVDYLMDVETGWIKPAGMQGFARIRRIMVLGLYKAAHKQRIRICYDYAEVPGGSSYTDDAKMTFSGLTAGQATQLRQGPSRQRCESIKIRITILNTSDATPAYDAVTLTGLALEVGLRRGLYPRLPAAQKQ